MSIGPKHWNVLLVDDEPDVLSITKLALQGITVDNLPLNIQTAASKAEAIELLSQEKSWVSHLTVAFIDVVMESDTAGLELCRHIREEMKNRVSQLYIRTGQPGVAPERAVIDEYDISGYFTKAEVTEDKLYSLVKSGIRQFNAIQAMRNALTIVEHLVEIGESKDQLMSSFAKLAQGLNQSEPPTGNALHVAVDGRSVYGPVGWDEQMALSLKEKLDASAGTALSSDGDKYVRSEDNSLLLIKIAANAPRPEAFVLRKLRNDFPEDRIITAHSMLRTFATLWARAE